MTPADVRTKEDCPIAITEEPTRSDATHGFLFEHPTEAAADVSAFLTRTGDE